jgi:hypothetical protein
MDDLLICEAAWVDSVLGHWRGMGRQGTRAGRDSVRSLAVIAEL